MQQKGPNSYAHDRPSTPQNPLTKRFINTDSRLPGSFSGPSRRPSSGKADIPRSGAQQRDLTAVCPPGRSGCGDGTCVNRYGCTGRPAALHRGGLALETVHGQVGLMTGRRELRARSLGVQRETGCKTAQVRPCFCVGQAQAAPSLI